MLIENAKLKKIDIPFTVSFKHSSAERSRTESVLVEMTSNSGYSGYGESCPREYVTSENIESVKVFFNENILSFKNNVDDLDSLNTWMGNNLKSINLNPAAMCAIETAFLDLLSKNKDISIESLIGVPELQGQFKYTAVIGDSSSEVFHSTLKKYIEMGFDDYKVKLSGDLEKDQEKCHILINMCKFPFRLRFDANNSWNNHETAIKYLSKLDIDYFAIEEPLTPKDYLGLSKLSNELDKQIILDESFLNLGQFENLIEYPEIMWIINLRISKMGGLLRSKKIVDKAKAHGIKIIIGAQVGETSLLSRAALTIANYARDMLIAQEGAFGKLLLKEDVFEPTLQFGKAGLLDPAKLFNGISGLGFENVLNKKFIKEYL